MWNEKINQLRELYGYEDNEKLISKFKEIAEDNQVPDNVRSEAYCAIGEIICYFAPELSEDIGYSYFKKALHFNEENIKARIGICSIFDTYPYPMNTILTEKEYLTHMDKLINSVQQEITSKTNNNILQLLKNYIRYRLKIINKE